MIKILIVDDSPTEAALIQHILESDKDMQVIGIAKNGLEAIELTAQLKPDVITMDIQMPVMDGLEATRNIMAQTPTPIVVISSTISDESIAATFNIIEAGALTALAKPVNIFSPAFKETKKYILDTIRSISDICIIRKPLNGYVIPTMKQPPEPKTSTHYEIIAIGASIGGPNALKTILSALGADFPLPIVIVQHMSPDFVNGFVQWLSENILLKVIKAVNNQPLQKGTVYIAAENKHLEILRSQDHLIGKLVDGPPVYGFCPSITRLLQSVAKTSGERAIGILLTGMSSDGAEGLLEIKKAHGHTFIQDEESAVVFGMGAVAQSLHAVDQIINLEHISEYLINLSTLKRE